MIRKAIYSALFLALLASPLAAGIVTLDPSDGNLTGAPGDTVGWGFSITNNSVNWISFTQSLLVNESNPAVGLYTDLIGPQGGPVNFALDPNSSWVESWPAQIGFGSYLIDANAVDGATDSGSIRVQYDVFTEDPNTCAACSATPFSEDVAFSVTVASPEPATVWLVSGALLAALVKPALYARSRRPGRWLPTVSGWTPPARR